MTGEHGGAAFILIYLIAVVLLGYPLLINEMILGRKAQRDPVGVFKDWRRTVLVADRRAGRIYRLFILSYYAVVAGWSLAYIYKVVIAVVSPGWTMLWPLRIT